MKIYLIDDKKIDKHVLPNKVDSSFLIHYNSLDSNEENVITIDAKDNKWVLKSNGNINIIINQVMVDETPLIENSFYYLKITGQSKYILLYSCSLFEELYTLDCSNINSISIGSNAKCNISFQNPLTEDIHCEIKKTENNWILTSKSQKSGTYINNEIIGSGNLKPGDIIFINGLKIIWMNEFIKLNNPDRRVVVNGLVPYASLAVVNNAEYKEVSDEEGSIDLYAEEDYFSHIPRMMEKIEHVEITIDSPPSKNVQEDIPFLLSIGTSLTMVASSFVTGYSIFNGISSGEKTIKNFVPQIIMLVTMIFGSLFIPRLITYYNKRKQTKREKTRQTKYQAYLKDKKEKIDNIMNQQKLILYANSLSSYEASNVILKKDSRLWSKQINDKDFAEIRLGIGEKNTDLTINAPEEHFTLDEDNLFNLVYKIVGETKILKDVPIPFSLVENSNVSFVFSCSFREKYIKGIITQLMAFHSAGDLKIIILTNKKYEKNWDFAKFSPHFWSDNKSVRFLVTNREEMQTVSSYLEEEYKKRKESLKSNNNESPDSIQKDKGYKNFPPYYLIFCDNYKSIKREPIVEMILKNKENFGFSFITMANNTRDLPSSCETFIQVGEKDGAILRKEIDSQAQTRFKIEEFPEINMRELGTKLSNIPIMSKDDAMGLPNSISFLEMCGVSKIEQLNILNKWKSNNPVVSLATPVGVKTNGELFMLDLHEKFHGPHGLIAGSTGSGKSEFIITFILSMAVNYHPYEAQFVLIDYKGGGLAGAFENKETGVRIPHLTGTITNLDTSEMNRTLVSINSELKRRQRIFNEVKDSLGESTIDIYKYQRLYREGLVKEPLAHLFIISDEFAELKSQRPEFMDQLISTARIGRSLGLHLILATQKPSGVVNDQIWSNSKFKVCLKVQDRSDSMEMLKRPEAASLREVGRFYLQVGYDDYFDIGQSAWGGAKYIPSNRIIKKTNDSIDFINNVGYIIKSISDAGKEHVKKEKEINLGDQLTNTVKYIHNLSIEENIKPKKMWLDIIPGEIYIGNLIREYGYKSKPYFVNPVIGKYDKPQNQEQGLLNLDLTNGGNTIIYGQSGSGKEMLISTIIWSCITEHSPQEVNLYIIDCGAETLKSYYKMPHVGEIATVDEEEKIINIFTMTAEELEARKKLFSDYSGNYINYCENSGQKVPLIIVTINGYDIFSESYSKLSDSVQSIYRECSKYGIIFIVSTISGVRGRMAQNFNNKIALQLSDDDYRSLIPEATKGLIPGKYVGRGIISKNEEAYEFQTAYIYDMKEINKIMKQASETLNKTYKERAKKIVIIPDVITLDLVINQVNGIENVPIGYNTESKEIFKYNFLENKVNIVLSNSIDDKIPFIIAIAKEIKQLSKLFILDFNDLITNSIEDVQIFKKDFDKIFMAINEEVKNDIDKTNLNVYIMSGLGSYLNKMTPEVKSIFRSIFNNASSLKNNVFILFDEYSSHKAVQLEQWYSTEVNSSSGIWLGEGIGSQIAINLTDVLEEDRKKDFPYMGLAVQKGKTTVIKCVFDTEE